MTCSHVYFQILASSLLVLSAPVELGIAKGDFEFGHEKTAIEVGSQNGFKDGNKASTFTGSGVYSQSLKGGARDRLVFLAGNCKSTSDAQMLVQTAAISDCTQHPDLKSVFDSPIGDASIAESKFALTLLDQKSARTTISFAPDSSERSNSFALG